MAKNKTFVSINSLTPLDRNKLKNAISELNDSMTRVASEQDLQKDVLSTITDELGIDKKLVKKIAKTYYKSSFNHDCEANKSFEEFYTVLLTTQEEHGTRNVQPEEVF